MKEYTEEEFIKSFKLTSAGLTIAHVTVLPEPEDKSLQTHAGRKGTMKFCIQNGKRIFREFVREF